MAAGELFASRDCGLWRDSLDRYEEAVRLVTSQKKRREGESLILLDKWYQRELPSSVASRNKPHLTHPELCKLMKWKLTRGKFRPRLTELVRQNDSSEVETVTEAAIAALPDLERAVTLASKLKAVGPATASASSDVPFMADEAAGAVPGLGRLTYSLKQYLKYTASLQEKAKQLSSTGEEGLWTAHDVELALWAHHHHSTPSSYSGQPGKRKREEEESPDPNHQEQPQPDTTTSATTKKTRLSNST